MTIRAPDQLDPGATPEPPLRHCEGESGIGLSQPESLQRYEDGFSSRTSVSTHVLSPLTLALEARYRPVSRTTVLFRWFDLRLAPDRWSQNEPPFRSWRNETGIPMRLALRIAAFVLPSALATMAIGQTTLPQDIVGSTRPLSSQQRSAVEEFATDQMNEMANGDPTEVVAARNTLVQTARRAGVTGVFLRAYSDAILPQATSILGAAEPMRAENTLRVLAFLRTPESLGILVSSADPLKIGDEGRRLVAAGLLKVAVEGGAGSGLDSAVLTSTARTIAENLDQDTSWIVVLEELRALNAIALSSSLTKENQNEIRGIQFGAFQQLSTRIEESAEPSELIQAVYRAMLGLREKLLGNSNSGDVSNKEIANTLRMMLKNVADAAIKQWSGLQTNRRSFMAYEGVLRVGSQLLSLLDGRPDPKAEALREGIEKGRTELAAAVRNFQS